jgi:hypothetical protein
MGIDSEIPENKHIKMAMNHLTKVLNYAPMVAEDGRDVTVHLTQQDWQVVADALFRMNVPDEQLPDAINDYDLVDENRAISLTTPDYDIKVEIVES